MTFGMLMQIRRMMFTALGCEGKLDVPETILRYVRGLLVFLAPLTILPISAMAVGETKDDDDVFWESVSECRSAKEVGLYLSAFPKGKYVTEASGCIAWEKAKDCEDIELVEAFLREFPKNRFEEDARTCLAQLEEEKHQNVLVERMLAECRAHHESHRLTAGSGGNALDCYRKVLDQDPGNAEALSGISRIEQHYINRAESALELSRPDTALPWIERLASINPEHPLVEELKGRVDDLKEHLATRKQLLSDIEAQLAQGQIEQARSILDAGRKEYLDSKTVSSLERKIERAAAEVERERSLQEGVAGVRALIEEGNMSSARSAIEELTEMGLDEGRRTELESALVEAERELSLQEGIAGVHALIEEGNMSAARSAIAELAEMGLDESRRTELESALEEVERERLLQEGIARVRDYIAKGNISAAQSAIEELVEMGLDEGRRTELEFALTAAVEGILAKCDGQLRSGLLAEALGCCGKVLEYDKYNAGAAACIGRVAREAWRIADDEGTVEGYYRFAREYSESVFALLADARLEELESEYWRSIQESGDASNYLRYLEIYPEGLFRGLAEIRSSLE